MLKKIIEVMDNHKYAVIGGVYTVSALGSLVMYRNFLKKMTKDLESSEVEA